MCVCSRDNIVVESVTLVCATTKKAKACKNCSCGLAEELEANHVEDVSKPVPDTSNAKSSCGSVSQTQCLDLTFVVSIHYEMRNITKMTHYIKLPGVFTLIDKKTFVNVIQIKSQNITTDSYGFCYIAC